jgi:colicin import membrane protein/protein TonB
MGGISLILHIALVVFLNLNPWPSIVKITPAAYTVTLIPISLPEPEIQKTSPPAEIKEEIPKPIEKPKKDDIVEKIKKPQKEKPSLKHLQEAIEEIRKKAALDRIQETVARREKVEEKPAGTPSSPVTKTSSLPAPPLSRIESKMNEYYSLIWAKIKEAWTIPENLIKETADLETIIVIMIDRDGKVQKWWFEKKSGNTTYDQSAIRALKKAEPLPPIPKELGENTLEIGLRFTPEEYRR